VAAARAAQAARLGPPAASACNSRIPPATLERVARPGTDARRLLRQAVDRLGLSARGLDRLLRVARTIADLSQSEEVRLSDLAEALSFRCCEFDTPEVASLQDFGEGP
jgi:magnesium chelatase family protein